PPLHGTEVDPPNPREQGESAPWSGTRLTGDLWRRLSISRGCATSLLFPRMRRPPEGVVAGWTPNRSGPVFGGQVNLTFREDDGSRPGTREARELQKAPDPRARGLRSLVTTALRTAS